MVLRPQDQPDPLVAELAQVPEGLLDGHRVVTGDPWEVQGAVAGVQQDRRHSALEELGVVAVRGVLLGIETAEEHDARDLLLQQQVDVLRLGHPAGGLGAEHRCEAVLRQGRADALRERGEDRVLQLGQHQPHQPGALPPQLGRPFVPEHVQRGQHGRPGVVRNAGPVVEHAADRRLAHPDLLRHCRKSSRHDVILGQMYGLYFHCSARIFHHNVVFFSGDAPGVVTPRPPGRSARGACRSASVTPGPDAEPARSRRRSGRGKIGP